MLFQLLLLVANVVVVVYLSADSRISPDMRMQNFYSRGQYLSIKRHPGKAEKMQ